jgi:hypothetical protein
LFPDKAQFLITFEVNTNSQEDKQLARIFLLELHDSKRQVTNAPGVTYHDAVVSDQVEKNFPGQSSKTTNGQITFVVSEVHIRQGTENILSQLIGFRQYLAFHLCALKI